MAKTKTKTKTKKTCKCCGKTKNINDFYKNNTYKDKHLNICKDCQKQKVAEHKYKITKNNLIKKIIYISKEINCLLKINNKTIEDILKEYLLDKI